MTKGKNRFLMKLAYYSQVSKENKEYVINSDKWLEEERRNGIKDRRKNPTYIADDRRNGITDRRKYFL